MSSIYGYIQVSIQEQNETRQQIAFSAAGIVEDMFYMDKLSGKDFNCPQYKKLLWKMKKATSISKVLTGWGAATPKYWSNGGC